MHSSSLANWDGGQYVKNSWSPQSDARYSIPPATVSEKRGDGGVQIISDVSMDNLVNERVVAANDNAYLKARAEKSPFLQYRPDYDRSVYSKEIQRLVSDTISTNEGQSARTRPEAIHIEDLKFGDATLRQSSHVASVPTEPQPFHVPSAYDIFATNNNGIAVQKVQRSQGGEEVSLEQNNGDDLQINSDALNDVSSFFDDDCDVTTFNEGHFQDNEIPLTIAPELLHGRADSPAADSDNVSYDIPTNIFHTPSRSASESYYSISMAKFPSRIPPSSRRRVLMSHVSIPPFSRGLSRSDYQPMSRPQKTKRRARPQKSRLDTREHMSMGEALQAAMNNNGGLYTLSNKQNPLEANVVRKKPKPKQAKGEARYRKAGTSYPSTSPHTAPQLKPTKRKAPVIQGFKELGDQSVIASTSTPLHLASPLPAPRFRRREFGSAVYKPTCDVVELTISGMPCDHLHIVAHNTRFLRQRRSFFTSTTSQEETSEEDCYAVKCDTYTYVAQSSPWCESLSGAEDSITIGNELPSVGESDAEEYELVTDDERQNESDDEIQIIDMNRPQQPSTGARTYTTAGVEALKTPVVAYDAIRKRDEFDIPLSSIKQSGKRPPEHAQPQTYGVSTSNRAGDWDAVHDESYRSVHSSHSTLPFTGPLLVAPPQEDAANDFLEDIPRKRQRTDIEAGYLPSAKALGKRRATSHDADHDPRLHPSPTMAKSHSEPMKTHFSPKSNSQRSTTQSPPTLRAMSNFLANVFASHPAPPLLTHIASIGPPDPADSTATTSATNLETPPSSTFDLAAPLPDHHPTFSIDDTSHYDPCSSFLIPNHSHSPSPFLPHATDRESPFLVAPDQTHDDGYLPTPLPTPVSDFGFYPSSEKPKSPAYERPGPLEWAGGPGFGAIDPTWFGPCGFEDQETSPPSPDISPVQSTEVSSSYLALVAYDSDSDSASSRSTTPEVSPPISPPSPQHKALLLSPSSSSSSEDAASSPSVSSQPSLPLSSVVQTSQINDGAAPVAMVGTLEASPAIEQSGLPDLIPAAVPQDSDGEWLPPTETWREERLVRKRKPTRPFGSSEDSPGSQDEGEMVPRVRATVVRRRPRDSVGEWPLDSQPQYCHQCRNKTNIRKLICKCNKRYCVRCLSLGYDASTYVFPCPKFVCPFCDNACTCTMCTRKRGEVYVPLRPKTDASPTARKKPVHDDDHLPIEPLSTRSARKRHVEENEESIPPRTRRVRKPLPSISGPVNYWGAIYGIRGERIGDAFVGDNHEEAVLARLLPGVELRAPPPEKHIFVGKKQASWGLGRHVHVKDLVFERRRRRSANARFYVGAKEPLLWRSRAKGVSSGSSLAEEEEFLPFKNDDDDDDDMSMSSLSSLTESEDEGGAAGLGMVAQEDVDEFLEKGPSKEFTPDGLIDTDVARAIGLSLVACGMTVQFSSV